MGLGGGLGGCMMAARIAGCECPPELAGKEVWRFTPNSLPGLSSRQNWQGTFDHLMSALFYHFDVNTGIMWGSNYNPDGDGWLPESPSGGGGHSLHSYMPAMRQGRSGVQYGAATHNSWADRWGLQGKCVIPERAYRGPVGGWFAVRVITDEGGIVPPEQ